MLNSNGKVVFDEKAMFDLLNNPKTGAVGNYLQKIGLEIKYGARAMVGVRTGALKASLYYRQGLRGRVQYVQVGSNVKHAYMHHEGTRRHQIRGNAGRLLRINAGGKVIYVRKVNHPGTKPNRYLTTPMKKAVRG